ncbi:DUF2690 domain-containing protein [Streptomyces sp. NPDC052301]|uniref:helix-turn-helix domain-containing protein n=1 Tax=Streptomyces sp. NPDC052301 TaxID=3365687 RepID=UPI0037D3A620
MPRWKALPEELDPQIKEFTSQLRRLVDRSGLSVAALADRTGYSKTSWERYLGGRLLAPKGAIVALAEVTGTSPIHLTTMWELAERAWSRAEMRHDRTMEAIRISQARAALGDFGAADAAGDTADRKGSGTTAIPGVAGPAGVSPTIPAQPTGADADAREGAGRGPAGGDAARSGAGRDSGTAEAGEGDDGRGASSGGNSWGLAGYQGPSRAGVRSGAGAGAGAGADSSVRAGAGAGVGAVGGSGDGAGSGSGWSAAAPNPYGGQPQVPRPGSPAGGSANRQRLTMFLAGLVGVLVVIAGVFFFTDRDGGKQAAAATKSSPSAGADPSPPAGVKCAGSACTGKDAEAMGCSGDLVTTAKTATVGTTTLEVRYSRACGTAWGRITGATQGDKVEVSAGKARQTGDITSPGDSIAYTPMVAVKDAAEAKACATLASGRTGCTK